MASSKAQSRTPDTFPASAAGRTRTRGTSSSSIGNGASGTQQVGSGVPTTNTLGHALLWSGTPDSYVDLQSNMPANFVTSGASTITGDTVYGYATDTAGNYHAIAWTVYAPEPAGLALAGVATMGLLARRRKVK